MAAYRQVCECFHRISMLEIRVLVDSATYCVFGRSHLLSLICELSMESELYRTD